MIIAAHAFLATSTDEPAWALTKDEAEALAVSCNHVLRHYDIKMSQKTLDFYALAMCAGGIYGPRLALVAMKNKAKQSPKAPPVPQPPPQNSNITPLNAPRVNGSGLPIG